MPSADDIDTTEDVTLQSGKYILHFERFTLTDEFVELARKELRETPERRAEAVAELKKLIEGDGKLYIPHDNDEILVQFLRPCKFYPESAFGLIQRCYGFKLRNPRLCRDLLPSNDEKPFVQGLVSVLPKRDQRGRRLMLIVGGRRWKPRQCSLNELIRGIILLVETAVIEAKTQIAGGVVIMDLEDIPLNHLIQFSPGIAKTIVTYMQDCIPIRLHGVHIVRQNYAFNMIFKLFKPFLGEKLRERVYFHGHDTESLLKHIDAKSLPVKYGGELDVPELPGEELHGLLARYEKEFKKFLTYGYSEDKK